VFDASQTRRTRRTGHCRHGNQALLGRDEEEARAVRPPKDDASVQDRLGDWPED
jgi:hypothetical protein